MSTRSSIHSFDGTTLTSIYCHYDGYPSNQAPILLDHFNTPEKVEELLSFGDLSSLDKNIGDCVFYGRDHGETDTNANVTTTSPVGIDGFPLGKSLPIREDYQYLYYIPTKTWYLMKGSSIWEELTENHYSKS